MRCKRTLVLGLAALAVMAVATISVEAKPGRSGHHGGSGPRHVGAHKPLKLHGTGDHHIKRHDFHRPVDKLLAHRGPIHHLTPKVVHRDYHFKHGIKGTFGYCYKGHTHHHWEHRCWLPSCNCHCYWCPCTSVYYYWCQPDSCWYPITHCPYGKYTF